MAQAALTPKTGLSPAVALLALPLVGLALLLALPAADLHWQHNPGPFLARPDRREPQRDPRVLDGRGRPPARGRPRPSRLARLSGRRRVPRSPRARDSGCPPRRAEPRLRDLDPDRARARGRTRGSLRTRPRPAGHRTSPPAFEADRTSAPRRDRPLDVRLARLDSGARGRRRAGAALGAASRALDPRNRALCLRRHPLPGALPRSTLDPAAGLRGRLRAARRGDDRGRRLPQLAAVVVGMARTDADRVRRDRVRRPPRVARGALRRALSRSSRNRGDRPLRRSPGIHRLLGEARPGGGDAHAECLLRGGHPGRRASRRQRRSPDRRCRDGDLRRHRRRPSRAGGPRRPRAAGGRRDGRRRPTRLAALSRRPEHGIGKRGRPRLAHRAAGRTASSATRSTSPPESRASPPRAASRSEPRRPRASGARSSSRSARSRSRVAKSLWRSSSFSACQAESYLPGLRIRTPRTSAGRTSAPHSSHSTANADGNGAAQAGQRCRVSPPQ